MSPASPPSSFTTHTYIHIYSVFLMALSSQVLTVHIYAISNIECCKKYFKILIVEKIKVQGPLNEGALPLSHGRLRTYSTPLFSVNEPQELWCPELFHKEGQSVLSGMGKASAREFRIATVCFFFPGLQLLIDFLGIKGCFSGEDKGWSFGGFPCFAHTEDGELGCLWLQCCKYSSYIYIHSTRESSPSVPTSKSYLLNTQFLVP